MNLWSVFYGLPQVPFYKEPTSSALALHKPQKSIHMYSNITMSSNKEPIVTSALEIIDTQEKELQPLRERQLVLISLAGILFVIHLLF